MARHLSFELLNRLVASRASTAEVPKAARHLAGCGRCRSELEWLQRIQAPSVPHPVERARFDFGSEFSRRGQRS